MAGLRCQALIEARVFPVESEIVKIDVALGQQIPRVNCIDSPEGSGVVRLIIEDVAVGLDRTCREAIDPPAIEQDGCFDPVKRLPDVGFLADRYQTRRTERHLLSTDTERQ